MTVYQRFSPFFRRIIVSANQINALLDMAVLTYDVGLILTHLAASLGKRGTYVTGPLRWRDIPVPRSRRPAAAQPSTAQVLSLPSRLPPDGPTYRGYEKVGPLTGGIVGTKRADTAEIGYSDARALNLFQASGCLTCRSGPRSVDRV